MLGSFQHSGSWCFNGIYGAALNTTAPEKDYRYKRQVTRGMAVYIWVNHVAINVRQKHRRAMKVFNVLVKGIKWTVYGHGQKRKLPNSLEKCGSTKACKVECHCG